LGIAAHVDPRFGERAVPPQPEVPDPQLAGLVVGREVRASGYAGECGTPRAIRPASLPGRKARVVMLDLPAVTGPVSARADTATFPTAVP